MPALQMTNKKEERKFSWVHKKEQRTVHFLYVDGHLSSQKCGVTTEFSKNTKAELYSEVTQ